MVYQTFSLWVEEFLGEKFSTGKKSSHFKRKILTANFSVQNKNCHTKTKFSRRKKNSQSELKKKCVCVGGVELFGGYTFKMHCNFKTINLKISQGKAHVICS